MNQRQNNLPDNPTTPPSSLAVVLEVGPDDAARVRRWTEQLRDKSIQVKIQDGKLSLRGITPEELWHRIAMFEIFGVTDPELQLYLGRQVRGCFANSALAGDKPQDQWTEVINVARALLQGLAPRDAIEAQLAVQMIAVCNAAMDTVQQAGRAQTPLALRQNYANYAVKMMRLFLEQMEALRKHSGGGMQQVVVKHVQVNDGGQAIVGHVEAGCPADPEGRA